MGGDQGVSASTNRGFESWSQTISLILTVVTTAVAGALWVQAKHHSVVDLLHHHEAEVLAQLAELQSEQMLLRERTTADRWTRTDMERWSSALRDEVDHAVPGLAWPSSVVKGRQ